MSRHIHVLFIVALLISVIHGITELQDVVYSGRWDRSGTYSQFPAAQWPGSNARFTVYTEGNLTLVNIKLVGCTDDCSFYLDIEKDGASFKTFEVNRTIEVVHFVFESHEKDQHDFKVSKMTDTDGKKGIFSISGVSTLAHMRHKSHLMAHSNESQRKIRLGKLLVIGDSISTAYGVDGLQNCEFSAQTENVMHSYSALVSKQLDLELHLVAMSSKGMVRNFNDTQTTSDHPMPSYYNRTIDTDTDSFWDPALFQADVVIVALGSNDYSTTPYPSDVDFISGYIAFLMKIQADYPASKILCLCEPQPGGNEEMNVEIAARSTGVEYLRIPDTIYDSGTGCDGYPNYDGQQAIANVIGPKIKELLY